MCIAAPNYTVLRKSSRSKCVRRYEYIIKEMDFSVRRDKILATTTLALLMAQIVCVIYNIMHSRTGYLQPNPDQKAYLKYLHTSDIFFEEMKDQLEVIQYIDDTAYKDILQLAIKQNTKEVLLLLSDDVSRLDKMSDSDQQYMTNIIKTRLIRNFSKHKEMKKENNPRQNSTIKVKPIAAKAAPKFPAHFRIAKPVKAIPTKLEVKPEIVKHINWRKPQLHKGGEPQLHNGGEPQLHKGGEPQLHKGGDPQLHKGGDPQLHKGGEPQLFKGGEPQLHKGGEPQLHKGGEPQLHKGGEPQLFKGGEPQLHKGGEPQLFKGGEPQLHKEGEPQLFKGGEHQLHKGGEPQLHKGGEPQLHKGGEPQLHKGGKSQLHKGGEPQLHKGGEPQLHKGGEPQLHKGGGSYGRQCVVEPSELYGREKIDSVEYEMGKLETIFVNTLEGGRWYPRNCKPTLRIAIIIPYRDRDRNLKLLLQTLIPKLRRQKVDYTFYVVEQATGTKFNRGMIRNIGFIEARKVANYDCYIFNDVDTFIEDDRNFYTCLPNVAYHIAVRISSFDYRLLYKKLVGGILSFKEDLFLKTNGYPNFFFIWGGEDDAMYQRIRNVGGQIVRPNTNVSHTTTMKHDHDPKLEERHNLLKRDSFFWEKDGLSTLDYQILVTEKRTLYTWLYVKVDELKYIKMLQSYMEEWNRLNPPTTAPPSSQPRLKKFKMYRFKKNKQLKHLFLT